MHREEVKQVSKKGGTRNHSRATTHKLPALASVSFYSFKHIACLGGVDRKLSRDELSCSLSKLFPAIHDGDHWQCVHLTPDLKSTSMECQWCVETKLNIAKSRLRT